MVSGVWSPLTPGQRRLGWLPNEGSPQPPGFLPGLSPLLLTIMYISPGGVKQFLKLISDEPPLAPLDGTSSASVPVVVPYFSIGNPGFLRCGKNELADSHPWPDWEVVVSCSVPDFHS